MLSVFRRQLRPQTIINRRFMTTEPVNIEALRAKVKALDHEIATMKNNTMRELAEAENIRTHTAREIKEFNHQAIQKFAKEIEETAELLNKALEEVPEHERGDKASHPDLKNLYVGVNMTRNTFLKTLNAYKQK